MKYSCTKEHFLNDVLNHKMEILHDDGLYRHIRYSNNGSNVYRFDITTWAGYLCISGDMGCCVFSRVPDMFGFFVDEDTNFDNPNIINPSYWEEKIQSVASYKGVKEFSSNLFRNNIIEIATRYYDEGSVSLGGADEEEFKAKKTECLNELEWQVFSYLDDEPDECAYKRAYEFEFEGFTIYSEDLTNSEEYTFHYIWLCYAIVWGIMEYNNIKTERIMLDKID